jgi:hypothetical protein
MTRFPKSWVRGAGDVRYRDGGGNTVLAFVLYDLWRRQCYWCLRPRPFEQIEIDHIIPRATGDAELQRLIRQHDLRADFHVDHPANLAPICAGRRCNRTKSNQNYLNAPAVSGMLRRAGRLAPDVINGVLGFNATNDVTKALLRANRADLSQPAARKAFLRLAPAIVQKLAQLDEKKADFITVRELDVSGPGSFVDDDRPAVTLTLDARGRTTVSLIEEICGGRTDDVLVEVIEEYLADIHREARGRFEGIDPGAGPRSAWTRRRPATSCWTSTRWTSRDPVRRWSAPSPAPSRR